MDDNLLRMTSDHKMYTLENRRLIKKPLAACLEDDDALCVVGEIPLYQKSMNDPSLAYAAGTIFTDGRVHLQRTKGSATFTQKDMPEKRAFIGAVPSSFADVFAHPMREGREISSSAHDSISFKREPARILSEIEGNMVPWIMNLDRASLLSFLAGVIDGDGIFTNNRIMISVSREPLLQGVVAACLRLGIVPQVTVDRNIHNVQIVELLDELLSYTQRIKGEVQEHHYGSIEDVNHVGRVQEALEQILQSPLRMVQARQVGEVEESTVYNFEVNCDEELGKNFIVFTSRYTPVLVSNSHAAVVARGMGKCCVAGCGDISVEENAKRFSVDGTVVNEGDYITLNGSTGDVILGHVDLMDPELSDDFNLLMEWADEARKLGVRTNADTPEDAKVARGFGAEGIGLCRTEHMFFEGNRIDAVREMILAKDKEGRKAALVKLLPYQREDFVGIFEAMDGLPVTIRTLDPPLHEFLPKHEELIDELYTLRFRLRDAKEITEIDQLVEKINETEALIRSVGQLHEFNPMLGHRGCRLGLVYPEITEMQVRAIFEAAAEVTKRGIKALPEIMIPLVGHVNELKQQTEIVRRVAEDVMSHENVELEYLVGTMIELPRAALTADEIAEVAEFFSFGTNDLTQMAFGMSRDDAGKFLQFYVEAGILEKDPFQALDQDGVGQLVKMGVERGRSTRETLKVGICGEHGGEPSSVEFCHSVGLDYVSCSPYRVPIARLAAAQAVIKEKY